MIVILHVSVALLGLLASTYTAFSPSRSLLRLSYSLVVVTLVSGTYLVFTTHTPLLQACASGLFYLGAVSFGLLPARGKLANKTADR